MSSNAQSLWASTATKFIAPATITTTLLYYFGFLRSNAIAEEMGYDTSLLGLSTQDYLLRSVPPMTTLAAVGVVGGLVWWQLHTFLERRLNQQRPTWPDADATVDAESGMKSAASTLGRATRVLTRFLGWLILVGAVNLTRQGVDEISLLTPALFLVGGALVGYGSWLAQFTTPQHLVLDGPSRVTVTFALAAAVFTAVTVQATSDGKVQGQSNLARASDVTQPFVTIVAQRPLSLGTSVPTLTNGEWSHEGFVHLFTENDQHFVMSAGLDDRLRTKIYTVPTADIRLEFDQARSVPCSGFEDLPPGAQFGPGDTIHSSGVGYVVKAFLGDQDSLIEVVDGGDSGQHLLLSNAVLAIALGPEPRFGLWQIDYTQLEDGARIDVNKKTLDIDVMPEATIGEAFRTLNGDVRVDGTSAGRAFFTNGDNVLASAAIGGQSLTIDCTPGGGRERPPDSAQPE